MARNISNISCKTKAAAAQPARPRRPFAGAKRSGVNGGGEVSSVVGIVTAGIAAVVVEIAVVVGVRFRVIGPVGQCRVGFSPMLFGHAAVADTVDPGGARQIAVGSIAAPWSSLLAGASECASFVSAGARAMAEHRTDTVEQQPAADHAGCRRRSRAEERSAGAEGRAGGIRRRRPRRGVLRGLW